MSFTKARQQRVEEGVSGGTDHSLLCRVTGCGRRWSVDISHGRVCSMHDEQFSKQGLRRAPSGPRPLASIPTLAHVVKPFCDPEKDES